MVDIVLLLDSSGSLGAQGWADIVSFARLYLALADIGPSSNIR